MKKYSGTVYECVCHVVIGNTDNVEGRGASIELGIFRSHTNAVEFAKGKGVMGFPAHIDTRTELVFVPVEDGIENWKEAKILSDRKFRIDYIDPQLIRERALSKLTQDEKDILGLK